MRQHRYICMYVRAQIVPGKCFHIYFQLITVDIVLFVLFFAFLSFIYFFLHLIQIAHISLFLCEMFVCVVAQVLLSADKCCHHCLRKLPFTATNWLQTRQEDFTKLFCCFAVSLTSLLLLSQTLFQPQQALPLSCHCCAPAVCPNALVCVCLCAIRIYGVCIC